MNTKAWNIFRIIVSLAGIALIEYSLIVHRHQMEDSTRFFRIVGLLLFGGYLVSAVLRYRKGSDVSGS